jgi:ketosteroid isomerase-like protein
MSHYVAVVVAGIVLQGAAEAPRVADTIAIGRVIDDWHDAAARADEKRYFDHFATNAVFLGTDGSERWTLAEFRAYAHPIFAQGKGWTFVPKNRHVDISEAKDTAWFDEALDSESYGACRGTGVLRKQGGRWRIVQYSLSIPIPNPLAERVVALIREQAGKPQAKPDASH